MEIIYRFHEMTWNIDSCEHAIIFNTISQWLTHFLVSHDPSPKCHQTPNYRAKKKEIRN